MSEALPPIKGFLPTSLIDWEGCLCSAIFLPRCNFRCPFCHASQLVLQPEELETIELATVVEHLDANQGWLDGIEVSGGEPTLHKRLAELIATLRRHVPRVKLDTNGTRPAALEHLIDEGLIDFVAMDVKAPFGEAYCEVAGTRVDCEAVEASIDLLRHSGVGHEFRTTVVPGLHTLDDIVAIAELLGPNERLVLQQFAPLNCLDPAFNDRRPYGRDELRQMASAAGELLAECHVRGEAAPKQDHAEPKRAPL